MRLGKFLASVVGVPMLLLVGCSSASSDEPPGLANPASVYCAEQGGETEIVEESGGEVGYCNLPDGTRIEEWELYRSRETTP